MTWTVSTATPEPSATGITTFHLLLSFAQNLPALPSLRKVINQPHSSAHSSASQANFRSSFLPDPQFASRCRFGLHAGHRLALCCQICLKEAGSWRSRAHRPWAIAHCPILDAVIGV